MIDIHYNIGGMLSLSDSIDMIEIFSEPVGERTIHVPAGVSLRYLAICTDAAQVDIRLCSSGEAADIQMRGLVVGMANTDIHMTAFGVLEHDRSSANLHIVSLLQDGSKTHIDGAATIAAKTSGCSGHLLEENVLLGDNVRIKTLPMLDVHSNDVSAGHGCRIERLDDKKLFYLQSKGIPHTHAQQLMIEGYINTLFDFFDNEDKQIVGLKQDYLSRIIG